MIPKRFPPMILATCLLVATALLAGCAIEVVTPAALAPVQNTPTASAAEATDELADEPADEAADEAPAEVEAAEGAAMPEITTQGVDAATAQPFAEQALNTLAAANIDPASVTAITVEAVDWPDAGLGCPQPGQMYAAVITPGYRITLETGSEAYAVHSSSRLDLPFVLCEQA